MDKLNLTVRYEDSKGFHGGNLIFATTEEAQNYLSVFGFKKVEERLLVKKNKDGSELKAHIVEFERPKFEFIRVTD